LLKMHKPNVKVKSKDDFQGEFVIEPLERGFGHTHDRVYCKLEGCCL